MTRGRDALDFKISALDFKISQAQTETHNEKGMTNCTAENILFFINLRF